MINKNAFETSITAINYEANLHDLAEEYRNYLIKNGNETSNVMCDVYITKLLKIIADITDELLWQKDLLEDLQDIENELNSTEIEAISQDNIIDVSYKYLEDGIVQLSIAGQLPHKYRWRDIKTCNYNSLLHYSFNKALEKPLEKWDRAYIFYEFHYPQSYRMRDPDNYSTKALTDIIAHYFICDNDNGNHVIINYSCVADDEKKTVVNVVRADCIDAYYSKYMVKI